MTDPALHDPDLEQVVRDLEHEGAGELLDLRSFTRRFPSTEDLWRATGRPSGRAARHLLRHHREEVAQLLEEAALKALASDPRADLDTYVSATGRVRLAEIGSPEWIRRRDVATALEARPAPAEMTRLLARALTGEPAPSAASLAMTSLRFVPSAAATHRLAKAWIREGSGDAALTLLAPLAACPATARQAYDTFNLVGLAWGRAGADHKAAHWYRRAFERLPRALAAMNWLGFACMAGDRRQALIAAHSFDDVSVGSEERPRSRAGDMTRRSPHARAIASLIQDSSGVASSDYVQAFL